MRFVLLAFKKVVKKFLFIGITMKKLFYVLLICLFSVLCVFNFSACKEDDEEYTEGLLFTISSDEEYYVVSGMGTATETDVVIPSQYKGKPVTTVGGDAFNGKNITSITLKEGVKEIRAKAFMNCTSLESVIIPSTVTNIGTQAFFNTKSLKTLYYDAENCMDLTVHNGVFYNSGENSEGLIITIGKNVKRVPNYLFVPENNAGDDGTSPNVNSLIFEEDCVLEEIGERSFSNFFNVQELTIPATVKKIGGYSFINWTNLTTLNFAMDSQLETICRTAFYNGVKITEVIFPSGLKTIEQDVFYCSTPGSITKVVIPSSVEYVGAVAFHNHRNALFYLQSESVPTLWHENWNNLNRPVYFSVEI